MAPFPSLDIETGVGAWGGPPHIRRSRAAALGRGPSRTTRKDMPVAHPPYSLGARLPPPPLPTPFPIIHSLSPSLGLSVCLSFSPCFSRSGEAYCALLPRREPMKEPKAWICANTTKTTCRPPTIKVQPAPGHRRLSRGRPVSWPACLVAGHRGWPAPATTAPVAGRSKTCAPQKTAPPLPAVTCARFMSPSRVAASCARLVSPSRAAVTCARLMSPPLVPV